MSTKNKMVFDSGTDLSKMLHDHWMHYKYFPSKYLHSSAPRSNLDVNQTVTFWLAVFRMIITVWQEFTWDLWLCGKQVHCRTG